jgi:hypothetical protein
MIANYAPPPPPLQCTVVFENGAKEFAGKISFATFEA